MNNEKVFDCLIVGGGLAGLSLAILLAQKKYSVLLVEKKSYPYHKVCGEYISNESKDFLKSLGLNFNDLNLPQINVVEITDTNNQYVSESMKMGGFGISRYAMDKLLAERAKDSGVHLLEKVSFTKYEKLNNIIKVHTSKGVFQCKILVGAFGRYTSGNFYKPTLQSEKWVGIKYHIRYDFPGNKIALHTFDNGYCGISRIENGKCCLCYLVKAKQLKKYKNDIAELERHELSKNPHLKKIFADAEFIFDKPLTISNITFDVKEPVSDGVFYIGDSAGAIAPLTGNGMSNAMRSTWLLSLELDNFFHQKISFKELEKKYKSIWKQTFSVRIRKGKVIQNIFCNKKLTKVFIFFIKKSSWLRRLIISQTHGEVF